MNKYTRNCPSCNIIINYNNQKLLNQAIKRNSKCYRGCLGILKNPFNKICAKCKKEKSKDEFGTIRNKINRHCKACGRGYGRKSYYKNKKSRSESSKRWYAKNPSYRRDYDRRNPEIVHKKNKKWRDKNPDYDTNYRVNNKEAIKARNRRWQLNNPDKNREASRRRRARALEVNEKYTANDEKITKDEFNHKCYNCGSTHKLGIDHHRPLSKGNPLTLDNAVLLCFSCNPSKGDKDPKDFYTKRKYIRLEKKLSKIGLKYQASSNLK